MQQRRASSTEAHLSEWLRYTFAVMRQTYLDEPLIMVCVNERAASLRVPRGTALTQWKPQTQNADCTVNLHKDTEPSTPCSVYVL
jgi:hypothetical protein